jgi:hypothetical protein
MSSSIFLALRFRFLRSEWFRRSCSRAQDSSAYSLKLFILVPSSCLLDELRVELSGNACQSLPAPSNWEPDASARLGRPRRRTASNFTLQLQLLAKPSESLAYFVVLSDRSFDFALPLNLQPGVGGCGLLNGIAIFSNDASDVQGSIPCFAHKPGRSLLQLL